METGGGNRYRYISQLQEGDKPSVRGSHEKGKWDSRIYLAKCFE